MSSQRAAQGTSTRRVQRYLDRVVSAGDLERIEVHINAAAPDLVCWLWAAFPQQPRGGLPVAKIAQALEVSPSTVRRWLKTASKEQQLTRAKIPPLNREGMNTLRRRAILRGRGHYLWPAPAEGTLQRSLKALETAQEALQVVHEHGPSARDKATGRTSPHSVHLIHYKPAHVYAIAAAVHPETTAKIWRADGEILETTTVPDYWSAVIAKETAMTQVADHRCICPRELIPSGRTETWLETAGPTINLKNLKRNLKVTSI